MSNGLDWIGPDMSGLSQCIEICQQSIKDNGLDVDVFQWCRGSSTVLICTKY